MMKLENQPSYGISEYKKVGMLLPPPVVFLLVLFIAVAGHWLIIGAFSITPVGCVLGLLLVIAGIGLIIWCGWLFITSRTPLLPFAPTAAIVISGPYQYSRNPMYLGMALLMMGIAVALGSIIIGFAVLLFLLVMHFAVVLMEERYLLSIDKGALHGGNYRQYQQKVRRWL